MTLLGWGATMADFDLDRDLDLAVFNGHVYPQADLPGMDTSYAQPDFLYRNAGDATFVPELLSDAGATVARACAAADLDGDGWLDLVAIELDGAVRVLRNRGAASLPEGERRHWLAVKLAARGGNRDALGARVTCHAGGAAQTAEIRTAGGYQAAVPPLAHFGLGSAERVERLEIRWPSGHVQTLADVAADRVLVVAEPEDAGGVGPAEEDGR
jgi:phytoene dehydrogenase-like protein